LQPPFFFQNTDMAINYGAIGAVIGHESTHGFDDQGRRFGPDGNLEDLWTPDDVAKFNARAECVVKQFDALSPLPGVQENGKLVEGEEIADLGGMTIAYKAFEKWQATHPRLTLDGYTPEQRFFIAYGQSWCTISRSERERLQALTNPHAPPRTRVNGVVADMAEFAAAFACKPGDKMVSRTMCRVW
jgi:predicted metalloendopeptidase